MFFPFMMDLKGQKVVIIGAGAVAFRKFELFRDFGAEITLVSPHLSPLFQAHRDRFHYIPGPYQPRYIDGAFAVIAAAGDPAVNKAVAELCRTRRIPVNTVDDPDNCTFIVPATVRRGDLTLAVSTGGKSPALAGDIRRQLAQTYGDDYARRLELLGQVRERVKAREADPEKRKRLLTQAARWDLTALASWLEEHP